MSADVVVFDRVMQTGRGDAPLRERPAGAPSAFVDRVAVSGDGERTRALLLRALAGPGGVAMR